MEYSTQNIQPSLEGIINELSSQIHSYEIPDWSLDDFYKYKTSYLDSRELYFQNICSTEMDIFSELQKCSPIKYQQPEHLSRQDLSLFYSGKRLKKRAANHQIIDELLKEIHKTLSSDNPLVRAKYLPFLSHPLLMFISEHRNTFLRPIESIMGSLENVSFDVGYFRVNPGLSNPYWHDDYTLFKNEAIDPKEPQPFIVNCHLALTPVTGRSSPLCFLQGAENIVYARAAFKYFLDNKIPHNSELFLKAIFLSEKLYTPGDKIKTNFLGLLPSLSYRLEKSRQNQGLYQISYDPVDKGEFLIFSPHLLHTSALKNQDPYPRESLVLRCVNDSHFCSKNLLSVEDFIKMLHISTELPVSINEVSSFFFPNHNIKKDTQLLSNIFIKKSENHSQNPRIYLNDLVNFFKLKKFSNNG